MIYRDFQGEKLSQLAFGAMRLPVVDGDDAVIDEKRTEAMVAYAMEHGVNYYDTAWGYHGGHSEEVMGRILRQYPRESYYLATKFPGYDLANIPKVREIFEAQIEKTRHDYFDFYLFHNVCELNIEQYLDPQYGIYDYLMEQKQAGRIRHLGFSCHGEIDVLRRFLEQYGQDMEFCQLQINYMDWAFQHGREKVELLKQYGIPAWIMEPLRGGKLASLREDHEARLRTLRPQESMVGWAFRFLQTIPEVGTILSGMSDEKQLQENIAIFERELPLDEQELDELLQVARQMSEEGGVPCTTCHYCVDHCPAGLDIPRLISLYNEHVFTTKAGLFGFIAPMAIGAMADGEKPSACLHCRSCEEVCPQQIRISEVMEDFVSVLGN